MGTAAMWDLQHVPSRDPTKSLCTFEQRPGVRTSERVREGLSVFVAISRTHVAQRQDGRSTLVVKPIDNLVPAIRLRLSL
jgi:hypothetical protein